jgi:hypothetical protein
MRVDALDHFAVELQDEAKDAMRGFGDRADVFAAAADYVLRRKR